MTEARDTGWFAKPVDLFRKPEWAIVASNSGDLTPSGPVGAEDLVGADGLCAANSAEAAPVQAAPAATTASAPATGTGFDGGLQTGPGAGPAAAPPVVGAIALGMTECQAVRRAGNPTHVAISAAENGERRVVLTYLAGPWPGIYTFDSGRLKVIDAAPVQEKKPEPNDPGSVTRASSSPPAPSASSQWPQQR